MLRLSACPVCSSSSITSYIETTAQMHSDREIFNFDQCADCNLVFLNPRVPLDRLKDYYTSYYLPYRGAKAWGKYQQLVENSQVKLDQKRVNRVREAHSVSMDTLVLDVGCGLPSFLQACHSELHCKTMGIDFSNEGWKDEPQRYAEIDLQVAEIKDLSEDLRPDVITMWHYLEHDYTPLKNLSHLKSISKPSTTLIIEIPNFESESRKQYGKYWAGWHTPRHTSLFSPSNVELLLNKSGWKVTKLLDYGTMDPYLLYWMSKMEKKQINWSKNMENEFWRFVLGMISFMPKKWSEKRSSLVIMTVVATPM